MKRRRYLSKCATGRLSRHNGSYCGTWCVLSGIHQVFLPDHDNAIQNPNDTSRRIIAIFFFWTQLGRCTSTPSTQNYGDKLHTVGDDEYLKIHDQE